jgi:hypothetical protein
MYPSQDRRASATKGDLIFNTLWTNIRFSDLHACERASWPATIHRAINRTQYHPQKHYMEGTDQALHMTEHRLCFYSKTDRCSPVTSTQQSSAFKMQFLTLHEKPKKFDSTYDWITPIVHSPQSSQSSCSPISRPLRPTWARAPPHALILVRGCSWRNPAHRARECDRHSPGEIHATTRALSLTPPFSDLPEWRGRESQHAWRKKLEPPMPWLRTPHSQAWAFSVTDMVHRLVRRSESLKPWRRSFWRFLVES